MSKDNVKGEFQLLGELYDTIDKLREHLNDAFHGPDGNELINVDTGNFYGPIDKLKEVEMTGWKLIELKEALEKADVEKEPCYKCGHENEEGQKWCDNCATSLR